MQVPRQRQSPVAVMDPAAFEQEALALVDRLYAAALRLTRNEADAQDLVQDTYLRAFRSSGQFEAGTNLRGWMFTILHNAFLNQRRDRGRSPIDADSEAVEQARDDRLTGADPEQRLLRETLDADLQAALDSLPATYREAVWLRDVEQFSYEEIAEILGVPIGTVMSRISRGRRALYDDLVARSGEYARRAGAGGDSRPRRV
jgi:RNA polymerase sigma-70 factor (ECF subfamily)